MSRLRDVLRSAVVQAAVPGPLGPCQLHTTEEPPESTVRLLIDRGPAGSELIHCCSACFRVYAEAVYAGQRGEVGCA